LDSEVAVKVVPTDAATPVVRRRFIDEARSMARIVHSHIVAVSTVENPTASLYIVMELVDGRRLADILKEEVSLGVPRALSIAVDVGRTQRTHAHELAT
jgi:serine/threonine-protein kinase